MVTQQMNGADLMEHVEQLARGVRISGSPDETVVFDYIEAFLKNRGFYTKRHAAQAMIGYPVRATVEVLAPERRTIGATGYALSPSTRPEGVTSTLAYVGNGADKDYSALDVRDTIVLSLGMGSPSKTIATDRAAPLAHICIDDHFLHEMCISPVWGSPTPKTLDMLPKTPSVGIKAEDGRYLRTLLGKAPVQVRVVSEMYRGWRHIPILVADLAGADEETFVLFSGHVDSWFNGAMDNAAANAVQLGVAQLFAQHRDSLQRGLRLAFWSGHSHGRYAGSSWYADHYWQELHDRCVCHVNIDSVGAAGAQLLSEAQTMAETFEYAAEVLRDQTGTELEYKRMSRAGDQSFWGIGIPSMFMLLSEHRLGEPDSVAPISAASANRQGANPWWWHTSQDTVDKIDATNLVRDARIYADALWGLCTRRDLPFDYAATAREIAGQLRVYQAAIGGAFDLSPLIRQADDLAVALERVCPQRAAEGTSSGRNRALMHIARALIPVSYTRSGPFDQDLALSVPPLPGIADALELTNLDDTSDEWHSLCAKTVRECNRVGAALTVAAKVTATLGE